MQHSIELYLREEFPHIVAKESHRSRRFNLRFNPISHQIVLTLPPFSGLDRLKAFLADSKSWIQKVQETSISMPIQDPTTLTLLGTPLKIIFEEKKNRHIWQETNTLYLRAPKDQKVALLESWLRLRALDYFTKTASSLCPKIDRTFEKISIKDTRTRWGSCSHKGTLSFSWRLLLAPPSVSFYVCAHEVAHLREMNHGPDFWHLVAALDPQYHHSFHWLKKNGSSLFHLKLDRLC